MGQGDRLHGIDLIFTGITDDKARNVTLQVKAEDSLVYQTDIALSNIENGEWKFVFMNVVLDSGRNIYTDCIHPVVHTDNPHSDVHVEPGRNHCIFRKAEHKTGVFHRDSMLQDDILTIVGDTHSELLLDQCEPGLRKPLAVWAFKHEMDTYFSVVQNTDYSAMLGEQKLSTVKEERNPGDSVIISTDEQTARWYLENTEAAIYEYPGCYFIYAPKARN